MFRYRLQVAMARVGLVFLCAALTLAKALAAEPASDNVSDRRDFESLLARETQSLPASVPAGITAEALRAGGDLTAGLPLPLAAHWSTGDVPEIEGFGPDYQLEQIGRGHYLLPWLSMPNIGGTHPQRWYFRKSVPRFAELKLPLALVGTQWEQPLTQWKRFAEAPSDANPTVVEVDPAGKPKRLCPLGPLEPWREVGSLWGASPLLAEVQQWYPDPPLVLLISNNEAPRQGWTELETSRRFRDKYGDELDAIARRKLVGDGWIERSRAMQQAMRNKLTPTWQSVTRFVAYDAFGPEFLGRWGGWRNYALTIPERSSPGPLEWDGASVSFYTNNWEPATDYFVYSPQVQAMNWVPMLDEAQKLHPGFWFELSVWDGHEPGKPDDKWTFYAKQGQQYSPTRYAGMAQFGMWLLRPRVVREFRGYRVERKEFAPYFEVLVDAVDRVHRDPILRTFWRYGELVPNRSRPHPYQTDVPPQFAKVDRWFRLDTNLDPTGPWELYTNLEVFSLALVLGEAPRRVWLLYGHAPLGDRNGVKVDVPDFGTVAVDLTPGGNFYLLDESTRQTRPLDNAVQAATRPR